jgi:hypothetical protein
MSTDFGTSMPTKSEEESIPSVGVVVALFVIGVVKMTTVAVVESGGLLKAGYATQPQCSTDARGRARSVGWRAYGIASR